jgi:hypothetical protein
MALIASAYALSGSGCRLRQASHAAPRCPIASPGPIIDPDNPAVTRPASGGARGPVRPADASEGFATHRLADLLAERRQIDELRERADAGSSGAAYRLVELLVQRGRLDRLAEEVAAGTDGAAERLARCNAMPSRLVRSVSVGQ